MDSTNRFDIIDPSAAPSKPADPAVEPDVETADVDAGDGATADSDAQPEPKAETPKPASKPASKPIEEPDLSEYLDEVAGKQITELRRQIDELKQIIRGGNAAPKAEPKPAPAAEKALADTRDDRVSRRQSQFISRTSSRDGNALSPEERAQRSVEELMRKRQLL